MGKVRSTITSCLSSFTERIILPLFSPPGQICTCRGTSTELSTHARLIGGSIPLPVIPFFFSPAFPFFSHQSLHVLPISLPLNTRQVHAAFFCTNKTISNSIDQGHRWTSNPDSIVRSLSQSPCSAILPVFHHMVASVPDARRHFQSFLFVPKSTTSFSAQLSAHTIHEASRATQQRRGRT